MSHWKDKPLMSGPQFTTWKMAMMGVLNSWPGAIFSIHSFKKLWQAAHWSVLHALPMRANVYKGLPDSATESFHASRHSGVRAMCSGQWGGTFSRLQSRDSNLGAGSEATSSSPHWAISPVSSRFMRGERLL